MTRNHALSLAVLLSDLLAALRVSAAAGGLALSLALVACGPPRASDTDGGSSTAMSSTSASSDTSGDGPSTEAGGSSPTTDNLFLPEDDDYNTYDLCDTWDQDCPEGEKCVPYASSGGTWDSTKCVSITGDQGPGQPCVSGGSAAATDDCGAGSFCWNVVEIDAELIDECVAMCTGSGDLPVCPEGSFCSVSTSGVLNLCLTPCDPLLQDCGVGRGCYWASNEFVCIPTDGGQPCGYINDCAPGSTCVQGEALPACAGSACCTQFCSLEVGDPGCAAAPETSCVPFFDDGFAPPEYLDVGGCLLP